MSTLHEKTSKAVSRNNILKLIMVYSVVRSMAAISMPITTMETMSMLSILFVSVSSVKIGLSFFTAKSYRWTMIRAKRAILILHIYDHTFPLRYKAQKDMKKFCTVTQHSKFNVKI